ncbi:MAG: DUF2059 domain-containing protein [Cyclobacteriaceae bacterium]
MKTAIASFAFLFLISATSFAQGEKEYGKTLKKMFQVSGTEEAYKVAIEQVMLSFKQQDTGLSADDWSELEKEFMKTSMNDLTEMLVPVYQKYMTLEDLKAMISFYETPVGKKFAKNTPMITQESMQVGQQWGMKIGQEIAEKIEKRK